MNYHLTRAQPQHLSVLPDIERAASVLFPPDVLQSSAEPEPTSLADLRSAQARGHLWVMLAPDQQPVGFALVSVHNNDVHLQELDVHPKHGRQGLGRQLVEQVCAWATQQQFHRVTLTTFAHLAWNGPFYARMGFVTLSEKALDERLRETLRKEIQMGLDPTHRIAMQLDLLRSLEP